MLIDTDPDELELEAETDEADPEAEADDDDEPDREAEPAVVVMDAKRVAWGALPPPIELKDRHWDVGPAG